MEYKSAIKEAKSKYGEKWTHELEQIKTIAQGWEFIKKNSDNGGSKSSTRPDIDEMRAHFKNLLQGERPEPEASTMCPSSERILLPWEEFKLRLNSMKERKAPGPDNLKAEALIYADEKSQELLRAEMEDILNG